MQAHLHSVFHQWSLLLCHSQFHYYVNILVQARLRSLFHLRILIMTYLQRLLKLTPSFQINIPTISTSKFPSTMLITGPSIWTTWHPSRYLSIWYPLILSNNQATSRYLSIWCSPRLSTIGPPSKPIIAKC